MLMHVSSEHTAEQWEKLGRLVRRAREARAWTAEQFAQRAGIGPRTLLTLERGGAVRTKTLTRVDIGMGWPVGTTEDGLVTGRLPVDIKPPVLTPQEREIMELPDRLFTREAKHRLIETLHRLEAELDAERDNRAV